MKAKENNAKTLPTLGKFCAALFIFAIVGYNVFWYTSDAKGLHIADVSTSTARSSHQTNQKRIAASKDYTALHGIALKGKDGNFSDWKIDTPSCPFKICEQCTANKPKGRLHGSKWNKIGMYYGRFCFASCDSSNLQCHMQKEAVQADHLVDCTSCRQDTQAAYFDHMGSVIETDACEGIATWGSGDDSKFLCKKLLSQWPDNCIILSLGGNGRWDFERDAYANSPCEIHTFDCTGSWDVPFEIGSRVTFHQKCVGLEEVAQDPKATAGFGKVAGNRMITMAHVYDIVGGQPDYMKMDIEGFEWQLLPSLMASDSAKLPVQIQVEIHQKFPSSLSEMIGNLRQRYSIVKRHDNPFCRHCSEILLVLTDNLSS